MTPEDYRHQNSPTRQYPTLDRAVARESWIVVSPGNMVSEVHRPSLDNNPPHSPSNNSVRLVNPPPLLVQPSEEFRTPPPPPEFGSRMSSTGSIPHGASPPMAVTPSNPNYKLPLSTSSDGSASARDQLPEPPNLMVPTTPREAIGHLDMSQPHPHHDREKEMLRRKNRASGMLVGMFSNPNPNHEQRASIDDVESVHSYNIPEKVHEKEWHGFRSFFGTSREKEKEKERERERERERTRPVDNSDRALWDMTRLIGWTTSTNVEDWVVVMEVCDKANQNDVDAKEASKALRKDIQFGRPPAQLAAARLWAIMMRNCPTYFIAHTTSRKFLGRIEEVALSPTTSPVIRDRLVEVVGTSVFQLKDSKHLKPYLTTWKKLRAQLKLTLPLEGLELNPDDPILNPTPHRPPSSMRHHTLNGQSQIDLNSSVTAVTETMADVALEPTREKKNTKDDSRERKREKSKRNNDAMLGIISQEEDTRRLFEECEISRDNCKILADSLVYATPESISGDTLIQEFRQKCFKSQEIIAAQIDWATAQADRARARQLALVGPGELVPTTVEEQLLDALSPPSPHVNSLAPPPPAPHGPRPLSRNRTPSPVPGMEPHEQATDVSSQEEETTPYLPSEKAMGKRRAEPQAEEEDEWPDHASLLPPEGGNDGDDENAGSRPPEVFMYDALAEKKKERALKGN
ncbi:hypothetical protein FRC07_007709 [Ceratobasidium sp. 392]|nr:hypothetical protein FRC07_007709 [Ceratobasidium sp. 392]